MVNRRSRYGWMTLGGLLCLLVLVLACKLRDGNQAQAQAPEPPAEKKESDKKTGEPPLAEPAPLPPVSAAAVPELKTKEMPPAVLEKTHAVAEVPAVDDKKAGKEEKKDSEPRPIVIPVSATTSGSAPPAPPPGKPSATPPEPAPVVPIPSVSPPPPPGTPLPDIAPKTDPLLAPRVGGTPAPPMAPDSPPSVTPSAPCPPPVAATPPAKPAAPAEHAVRPLPMLRCRTTAKPKPVLPLTGTYPVKLEGGKAMALPKAILEQLGNCDTVLLSPGSDRCLWLTNQAHLDRLAAKLDRSPARESDVRGFRRLYYAQVVKAPVKGGKVAISDRLAAFAGLGADVVLVGIDDHFEVWDAARWQRYTQAKKATPVED
jgi:division/cell wall cluster transcriptional repressor MraZ